MFDNSDTRSAHAADDVRRRLADEHYALAELDYPSHLGIRLDELARVRTAHLLDLVDQAVQQMTALSPGVAVTVVGHSMGAKLALLSSQRNPSISSAVLIDGWLIGPPGAEPLPVSPPVLELFGRGTRFKSMCSAVASDDQSSSAQKFRHFVLGMLQQRGMLSDQAVSTVEADPEFRRRTFSYLSRMDPYWAGGQKDEMSRFAQMDQVAWRARWQASRITPFPVLAVTCGSRPAWYEEATDLTLSAMNCTTIERSYLATRGHLDVLFGNGAGSELGDVILDWWRKRT